MKITPTGATPPAIMTAQTQTGVRPDVKAKVIAMMQGQQSVERQPDNHSIDPNHISPEEMSAVRPHTNDESAVEEIVEQDASQSQPEAKKVDPVLSRQFAQLAKAEKAYRAKEQALKAREAALSAKETELISKAPQIDPNKYFSVDELKQNTLRKLADAGITYEDLTQQILNVSPTDPRTEAIIGKQDTRIAQLEAKLEEQAKGQVESQQQARQAAVRQITRDVTDLVKMDPTFETIKATNSVRDVVELIEQTFDRDGIVLSAEEAAQEVENYLIEEAMKLTRIGKIKSRLEKAGQPAPTQKQQTQQAGSPMKTLTNAASSSRKLSARERALLAFKGELK